MTVAADADRGSFRHIALFYRSPQEYLDYLVPFVAGGVADGVPTLVAVPEPNLSLLHGALPASTVGLVTLADMNQVGRNPGHILGGVFGTFAARHPSGPVQMVGQPIWSGRSKLEYPACVQHEALVNEAFTGRELTMLCPYDATYLDSCALADAETTHPLLARVGHPERTSAGFAPDVAWARYNEPLPSSPTAASCTLQRLTDLSAARQFAAKYARWFGLDGADIADLQLIVNELASNGLQHGRGPCTLMLWETGGQLICQVSDAGHLTDRLAGRRPIVGDYEHGCGLFVVNATADLVRIHTTATGTTVQAHLLMRKSA
ncbi:sensor histidine kinase [Mycolicibacter icosiumassiliensis]|uniref:sensor histidine kinase n=1 Tax=Mycolicibacter icosiumassiliensis TaxID=1792835 RepID=UPI0008323685|nr:sensor histidine kinase [Mycolicibacter icosiumassiliensis]